MVGRTYLLAPLLLVLLFPACAELELLAEGTSGTAMAGVVGIGFGLW